MNQSENNGQLKILQVAYKSYAFIPPPPPNTVKGMCLFLFDMVVSVVIQYCIIC